MEDQMKSLRSEMEAGFKSLRSEVAATRWMVGVSIALMLVVIAQLLLQ